MRQNICGERRMRFIGLMFLAMAVLAPRAEASVKHPTPKLKDARFFYGPESSGMLLAVREGMEKGITFNGHFSQSYVPCGLACGTYFFVDRWTGGVITAPEGSPPGEIVWDVTAKPSSDVIKVTFGPMDGVEHGCTEQHFRLFKHKFAAIDTRAAIGCPK
ncbi:hypothetical protein [Novosphingobium sp.]|uniref:hypothetical protein n=1 Tax=Novosphingobium sp. TaxID=1874826 RepID=UPI0038B762BC